MFTKYFHMIRKRSRFLALLWSTLYVFASIPLYSLLKYDEIFVVKPTRTRLKIKCKSLCVKLNETWSIKSSQSRRGGHECNVNRCVERSRRSVVQALVPFTLNTNLLWVKNENFLFRIIVRIPFNWAKELIIER